MPARRQVAKLLLYGAALALGTAALQLLDWLHIVRTTPDEVYVALIAFTPAPNTIKTHTARLFDKLAATNRTQASARARGPGLLA